MVQVGEKRNLMKYFYPAIFTLDRKKNEFRAVFPDLTGCAVKAESMAVSYKNLTLPTNYKV